MAKNHLKSLAAPKTWPIDRKKAKFILRPMPGPHDMELSMPLGVILKDILGYSTTSRETRLLLQNKNVFVDRIRRMDLAFPVGIFDIISVDELGSLRVTLNDKGKIDFVSIDDKESKLKVCKIIGKSILKNAKIQLNLYDGRNAVVDKDSYKVGDSLLVSLPDAQIKKHLKLEKSSIVFLTGGKHKGSAGKVEGISGDKIIYRNKSGESVETLKEYAFVVGLDKLEITIQIEKKEAK